MVDKANEVLARLPSFGCEIRQMDSHIGAASISEPRLALRVGNPPQKSKHHDGLFGKYLEKDNV